MFLAVATALLPGVRLQAQAATGTVVGTVLDQQKASIPGASVIATNTATGVASQGATDRSGHFEIFNLPIGSYTVTVEHAGFQKTVTQAQALQINQTLRFSITLPLGTSNQAVTVAAEVSGVETENATVGDTVSGDEIHDLPLNGRNVLDLAQLQPGVTPANSAVGGFSVAGGRPDSITYLLDGGLNNDLLSNSVVFNPNPDTVAEYRLLTSDYTAEYGRSGAGVVSEVTKSGTNLLHGSAFDYLRNGDLNAAGFFNNLEGLPRDTLRRNQYGGTIGGPITIPGVVSGHDKLFFFVGYQGQRQGDSQSQSQTPVPTPAELAGDFSKSNPDGTGTPEPGVAAFLAANPFFQPNAALAAQAIIDPSKINAVAAKFIAAKLIPTDPTGLLNSNGSATDDNNELTGKVDFAASASSKFTLTLGGFRRARLSPFANANVPGYPDTTTNNAYFAGLAHTWTISNDLLNEFHFNVQRSNSLQSKPAVSLPNAAALGFGLTPDLPIAPPNLDFNNGLSLGFSIQGPSNLVGTTWSYTDAVTWVQGRNNWKFGGGFSAYQQNMAFDFLGNGDFFFGTDGISDSGIADFLLGIPNFLSMGPNAPSNIRQKSSYGFVQDQFHMTPNLTLTAGLRYEYSSPKRDTRSRTFGLDPGKQSTVFANAPLGLVFPGDSGTPLASNFPDKDNFAPRLSFAWDPTGHGSTSIRGGAGIFYDVLKAEDNFQFNGQPPFASSVNSQFPAVGPGQSGPVTFLSDPFSALGFPNPFPSRAPAPNLDFAAAGFLPFAPPGGVFVNPHIFTPYIYQYNLSVQHQLGRNYSAEVNYVGSSSKGLTGLVDENPFVLGTTHRVLNPTALAASPSIAAFCNSFATSVKTAEAATECPFPIMDDFDNVGFASFNSMEASLTKRIGSGDPFFGNSYFTLAYTYGRSIDNESGFRNNTSTVPAYNHSQFRGPSDFDVTHAVVFNGSWTLPFANYFTSAPRAIVGGWRVDPIIQWHTGFPLTPNARLNPSGDASDQQGSGAGDAFLADAAFAPGFSQVSILNPELPGNHYFPKATFTGNLPADQPYGLPRGIFRGPSFTNMNLAVIKSVPLE
ncbi:MAG: TonB-dependent receptor domain-containing protein, partial [Terriglobales bacterium]